MKTNREDPAIEKCIWADLMVGSTYNALKSATVDIGLPGGFTLIPFLEASIKNKRNRYFVYDSEHFAYLITMNNKQQYFLKKVQPALDNFIQSCDK